MYNLLDWIDAIRFRWKAVLAVTGAISLGAVFFLLIATPSYEAHASLIVDLEQPDPVGEQQAFNDFRSIMQTQADMIMSPRVAGNAAKEAGLDSDPEYIESWRSATDEKVPYDEWLKKQLLGAVEVTLGRDTNLLAISAKGKTPEEASQIANGFAEAAVSSRYRMQTEPAKAYADWLEGQLVEAKQNVAVRETALSDLVRDTGLAQGGDLSSEGSKTAEIAVQLAVAEARAAAARQSSFSVEQSRGDVERSEAVQRLREQRAQLQSQLAELKSVYGPEHPDVQRTTAELATLGSQLKIEESNAQSAFSSSRQAAANAQRAAADAAEQRLRTLASQQRQRLQAQGENVAQYTTLQNEFTAAQNNYNSLAERLSEMKLQSEVPQTEVQVFDSASAFLIDREPGIFRTMGLAIILGFTLGLLLAILLEALNPLVRTSAGVHRTLGAPIIGTVALPRPEPRRLRGRGLPPLLGAPTGS